MTLPEPTTATGRSALAELIAQPAGALVSVDYDGTLAPIVVRPEDARADPAAVAALGRLVPLVDRAVVLTGRPARTAVTLGGLDAVAGLTVLGEYGLQRWHAGELTSPPPDPAVARARRRLPDLPEGVRVEDKELAFVVHTRPAADPDAALAALDGPLRALADEEGLEVVDGSWARELRPRGVDKGSTLLGLARAARPTVVLVLGDDDGDVPLVDAVAELRTDGVPGLVVCAAREGGSAALRQRADLVVDGVAGITALLTALVAALGSAG